MNPSPKQPSQRSLSSGARAENLRLNCITEGRAWWRLRSSPRGRADGIKITALKIEGVKGTPGPPDGAGNRGLGAVVSGRTAR
jgi:hypothetical protein